MTLALTPLDSLVLFRSSRGLSGRGTLLHLTRRSVAFELYNPYSIVQLSEVLYDFRVVREQRPLYQGRAVVSSLVPTGALTIVSATLVDAWSELQGAVAPDVIRAETERFIQGWERGYRLRPRYQFAVSALASFLQELGRWLGQAEAVYSERRSQGATPPRDVLYQQVQPLVQAKLVQLFAAFETEASHVSPAEAATHKAFAQRELHPHLLCDPFLHRTLNKPLGYAGDYQVVNMILAVEQLELNAYARILNTFNLNTPPAAAHRNRIRILGVLLRREARRKAALGKRLRVLNIGCGPAVEVQRFVAAHELSDCCEFTLVDFNEETLDHAQSRIRAALADHQRTAALRVVHQSIHELLEAAATGKTEWTEDYDLVYCAGLFDYLSDRVCRRLVQLFHKWTAPDGAIVATNVHVRNPHRYAMEHLVEWYLMYRDEQQLGRFAPAATGWRVFSDPTTVNLFLEIRKSGA